MLDLIEAKEVKKALAWLSKYWDRPIHPEYCSARTVDEAISLLSEHWKEAKIVAGAVDLLGLMKNKVIEPRVLINIKTIPNLDYIEQGDTGLSIGALTRINDIESSALINSKYPMLFEAAHSIGSPQIRNMGSMVGNLCQDVRCWYYRRSPVTGISYKCRRKSETGICYAINGENQYHAVIGATECAAVCPSDLATVLLALDARLCTVNTSGGRAITMEEFYTRLCNVLEPAEIITAIKIPEVDPELKQHFLKFRIRNAVDFAIVSVAALVKLDGEVIRDARIVLGGGAAGPYRALKAENILKGQRRTEELVITAANLALCDAIPLSKNSYKVQVAEALVKQVLFKN